MIKDKEPDSWRASRRAAVDRGQYQRKLAWEWLVINRPDVVQVILEESEKKYPRIRRNIDLPKSLEKLK